MGEDMGYFLMVLPCCPIWLSRKDLNSVTMVIMEWLWKSIRFSQFLCKRVIAIRWTFIPPNPNPNPVLLRVGVGAIANNLELNVLMVWIQAGAN